VTDPVDALRRVYWIGGGSGAGKSTVARSVADRPGFRVCSTDEAMSDHTRRSGDEAPYLKQFTAMDMDERWLNRSPETMLETFHWFRGEGFDLIVEDLLRLPAGRGVVVEGFRLLPQLVQPLLADSNHAVWLLPTPRFRETAFEARGTTWAIPDQTTDPVRARQNVLDRDGLFTDRLRTETTLLGLPTIAIDGLMSEDELADHVAVAFGL
jgi:hypothetical protein